MDDYLGDNPQIIVNGFIRSGIPGYLDGLQEDTNSGNESVRKAVPVTRVIQVKKMQS